MIRMGSHYELMVQEIVDQGNKTHPLTSITNVPTRRSAETVRSGEIIAKFDGFRRANQTFIIYKFNYVDLTWSVNMMPLSDEHSVNLSLKFTDDSFYEQDFTKIEIGIVDTGNVLPVPPTSQPNETDERSLRAWEMFRSLSFLVRLFMPTDFQYCWIVQ